MSIEGGIKATAEVRPSPGYALIARPVHTREYMSEYWSGGYWTLYAYRAMRFQSWAHAANYWRAYVRGQHGDCQILEVYECKA